MSSNPTTTTRPGATDRPANENELPAYRAMSRAAIASLILGGASILTFLSPYFGLLGVLAIAFGLAAQRNIRRLPDILTGTRMANAGTALGLLFTLSAFTIGAVQFWIIDREAAKFAREYVDALKSGSIDRAIFFENNPEYRNGKTVEAVAKEYRDGFTKSGMFEMQTQAARDIQKRLTSGAGQTLELGARTGHEVQGMDAYVSYLLVVKGPKSQEFPDETQYAAIILQGMPSGRTYGWHVKNIKFPVDPPR